jgi:hypothetical protein
MHGSKLGGGATGVTEFDAADALELTPYGVSRFTANVYAVPFERPETDMELHGAEHVPEIEPGDDVAL